MFADLSPQPKDPLLALIGLYQGDKNESKVDLGVGVYRDESGRTPVLRAVKAAELSLWNMQQTKAYIGPEGDLQFLELLWQLVGGSGGPSAAGLQTPGGSGALRVACELMVRSGRRRIHLGMPSWPNHAGIFRAAGMEIETHQFFGVETQTMLFDQVLTALERAHTGDAALLHASCHNPSGAVLSDEQWDALADVMERRGVIPLIDVAYQGFGKGLDEDAAGLRRMVRRVPEALVAVSSSKSFGLYRERVGAVYAVGASANGVGIARSNLVSIARVSYSMPPAHGAAIVALILADDDLRRDWMQELEAMRARLVTLRARFAEELALKWPALAAMPTQEGMFSLLPLGEQQIARARDLSVYMPSSGRINIAGLQASRIVEVADKLCRL